MASPEEPAKSERIRSAVTVAFRNVLVHAYFGIDWEEVWRVARDRCPTLREQVAHILQSLGETPS